MALSQYPRLADPSDIGRLLSGDRVHRVWPPTGTTVTRLGFPETWVLVSGEPSVGAAGDWWVTDLARIAVDTNSTALAIALQLGKTFTGPVELAYGAIGNWPVIFEQGKVNYMRWLATTFRGTLAGVEEFQFGLNWGNPGADPDPNEAETLAFATTVAGAFKTAWEAPIGGTQPRAKFMPDVVFTEVGAVVKTQTDATGADGSGGNLEQKFDTQWFTWGAGVRPTGTAASGLSLPFEVSCAVTLQTDRRGPRGRGRIYLPPFSSLAMAGGGVFDPAATLLQGQMIGALAAAVEAATGHILVVVSRRSITLNEVETINVGKVPDSQRRRRRSQDEARQLAWTRP